MSFLSVLLLLLPRALASDLPIVQAAQIRELQAELTHPTDVAWGPKGALYVADGVNNRIRVLDPLGNILRTIAPEGLDKGQMDKPLGLDVAPDGRILVADSGHGRVLVFSAEGALEKAIPLPDAYESPAHPADVAFAPGTGTFYVVDNLNHRVGRRSLSGGAWKFAGRVGTGKEQYRYPFLLSLDARGRPYVVDVINARVKVLREDLTTAGLIGSFGVLPGELYRPKGVTVDRSGRVYVSDSYLGVIEIYSRDGRPLGLLGRGTEVLRLDMPLGLAINKKNELAVVEFGKSRIRLLRVAPLRKVPQQ
jgi:DNA-binding beta-propeller fold protein YncE